MVSDPHSGSRCPMPFAFYDRPSSSWKTCQGSLLEDSGESCTTWPREGTWDLGFAYELPTWAPPTSASESSSLLPTPSAYESDPTDELAEEIRENMAGTHERLYLPGRKWHSQRTLRRIAGALLPTPSASDGTGAEVETRERWQEEGRTGGPSLRDLPKLLPTPAAALRGELTAQPFSDGPKSSVEQHPDQQTLEDA